MSGSFTALGALHQAAPSRRLDPALDREPLATLARLLNGTTIQLVDVGARDGLHHRWQKLLPLVSAIGFEADPDECARLNSRSGDRNIRFLPYALARGEGRRSFYVCEGPGYSGLYEPNHEFVRVFDPSIVQAMGVRKTVDVNTRSLDSVAAAEGFQPDCLKIDVQGAELDILVGGTSTLEKTKVVELEVEFNPQYRSQPLFSDVDTFMRAQNFVLLGLRRTCWRRVTPQAQSRTTAGGQIMHGDVLYYNARLLEASSDDPADLAVWLVLLTAYRQHDFVHQLLFDHPAGARLKADERATLATRLSDPPSWRSRIFALLGPLAERAGHRRLREWSDACRRAPAIDWHDPDFF